MFKFPYSLLIIGLLLAGCGSIEDSVRTPLIGFGDIEAEYHFDTPQTSWDTFRLPGDAAYFAVTDGALTGSVVGDRGYIWSLNMPEYQNTSIKANLQQIRGSSGNGFGVMCRADKDGNGYYFVISSAGQFAILKAEPGISNPSELVKWQSSGAVKTDKGINSIEAICLDDYLSFTVNGVFIAEARDSTFKSGHTGVVLGAVGQPLWVSFDDIIIQAVRVIGG
jgi:hypothetical protein